MRLVRWLRKLLPCRACRPIRQKHPLRVHWPIEVMLDEQGACFLCHRCGRTGRIARETIPRM
jgi:hypothetical protein